MLEMKTTRRNFLHQTLAVSTASLAFGGCKRSAPAAGEVVPYTSVDQIFAEPNFRAFQDASGVKARALFDTEETKSTGILNRLIAEADAPRADVFWSGDPIRPFVLVKRGLVEPYMSPNARDLPSGMRAADGMWTGVAARARVLLVNKSKVTPSDMPRTLQDLAAARFRGQTAIANPLFGTTTTHVAALFVAWGDDQAKKFLDDMKANGARIASSNGEVKRLVAAGEVGVGLTDTDDASEALKDGAPVEMVYPDQDVFGTFVMPTAVSLIKNAPHPDAGRKLIDYLLTAEVEKRLVETGGYMPLRSGVATGKNIRSVSEIRAMQSDYARVAETMERIQPWLKQWVGL
jgi:iron(III) transport system substrate-binding protein